MKQSRLTGKKLLILGANPETVPLVDTAKQMGVYVLVTDNNPNAFAKKFADKGCDVDGLNVPALIELVKNEKIDGVIVGVADRLIEPYQKVCAALNLPCYATKSQCEVLTNKYAFNQKCREYGISPIPSYPLSRDCDDADLANLKYPVFIKPVDGNSGKGMSICREHSEVHAAIKKAVNASRSGKFLVERYMDCDDIMMYFTFKDGEVWLSAIGDRFTCRTQGNVSRVCLGAVYPSRHVELYFSSLHDKFCRMFRDLNIQNGVLLVSGFVEGGIVHVYDPGFRLQGEAPNLHVEAINGFDQKEMLIRYALTGSMGNQNLELMNDCRFRGKYAATIWYLTRAGTISKIEGLDELSKDKSVFRIVQRHFVGDTITAEMVGTEAQVLARVYMFCESKSELIKKVKKFQVSVTASDIKGDSLILAGFDANLL